jgi:hypothetical protein
MSAIGSGTITNCTVQAFLAAIATGGEVTFECDGVITLANTLVIAADTTLQASGRSVSVSGGGSGTNGVRLFLVKPGAKFTVRNLSFVNGGVMGKAGVFGSGGEQRNA